MSLIDLIRGKSRTVATVAGIAVAAPPDRETIPPTVATVARIAVATSQEPPTDTIGIVATIEEIIKNSSFATAIPAIPATDPASLEQLPAALVEAATRCCVEIHGDGLELVQTMIDDLRHWPADSWPWLIEHFTAQLPPLPVVTTTPTTCGDCLHGRPTQHPAILECGRGVLSGLPIAGRWHTDRHDCSEFTDRTGASRRMVKTDPRPTQTENFNPDPFSFLET